MMTYIPIYAFLFACFFQAGYDRTIDFRKVGNRSSRAVIPIRNLKSIGMVEIDANYAVTVQIAKIIGDQTVSLKLFDGVAGDGISLLDAVADERGNISVLVVKHVIAESQPLGMQVKSKLELFELASTDTEESSYEIVRQTKVVADGIDSIVQASFLSDGQLLFHANGRVACMRIEREGVSRVDWIDGYETSSGSCFECPSFVRSIARAGFPLGDQLNIDSAFGRIFVGRDRINAKYYLQHVAQQWSIIAKTENGEAVVELDGEPLAWDIDTENNRLALVLVRGDRLYSLIFESDSLKVVSSDSLTSIGRPSHMRLHLMLHPQGFLGVYW